MKTSLKTTIAVITTGVVFGAMASYGTNAQATGWTQANTCSFRGRMLALYADRMARGEKPQDIIQQASYTAGINEGGRLAYEETKREVATAAAMNVAYPANDRDYQGEHGVWSRLVNIGTDVAASCMDGGEK